MDILKFIKDRQLLILLFMVFILGAGLRIYNLGTESYWYDEFIMVRVASSNFSYMYDKFLGERPPVYVLIAHLWIDWFGTSETATRSLSAIFGILSIPMMYLVGEQLFNKRVGIISALLISISQFQIYYSQEFRYYSLFLLTALASFYFYINFLRYRKNYVLIVYTIVNILLFHVHNYGIFVIFTQNLFLLTKIKEFRTYIYKWILSQIIILIFILPVIYLAYINNFGPEYTPVWHNISLKYPIIYIWKYVASGIPWDAMYFEVYPVPKLTLLVGGIIFLSIISFYYIIRHSKDNLTNNYNFAITKHRDAVVLSILWFICPLLIPFILTNIADAKYAMRYTIIASPAFYLLLSIFILGIGEKIPLIASIGFLLIIILPGLADYYRTDVKIQWKELTSYVQNSTTDEKVILIPDLYCPRNDDEKKFYWSDENGKNFNWYYKGKLPSCCMDIKIEDEEFDSELNKCVSEVDSFWLVLDDIADYEEKYYNKFLNVNNLEQTKMQKFHQVRAYSFKVVR